MKKTLTFTLSAAVAIGATFALYLHQIVVAVADSSESTDQDVHAKHATNSCVLPMGSPSTSDVLQQQIEAASESEEFFIGCGTIS